MHKLGKNKGIGELIELLVDPRIKDEINRSQASRFVQVAFLCSALKRDDRPEMDDVCIPILYVLF